MAIAARDQKRAQALADKLGFKRAYGSYDDFMNDPEVSKSPIVPSPRLSILSSVGKSLVTL